MYYELRLAFNYLIVVGVLCSGMLELSGYYRAETHEGALAFPALPTTQQYLVIITAQNLSSYSPGGTLSGSHLPRESTRVLRLFRLGRMLSWQLNPDC
jgi:hypothetical protein